MNTAQRARIPRDRMARVQVSDETWAVYRAVLGTTPVSVALGRLVKREVASRRRRADSDPDGVRQAVDDARIVVDELSALIARLERHLGREAAASLPTDRVAPANLPAASVKSDAHAYPQDVVNGWVRMWVFVT